MVIGVAREVGACPPSKQTTAGSVFPLEIIASQIPTHVLEGWGAFLLAGKHVTILHF